MIGGAGSLLDFFIPSGCVVCRRWIPRAEGPSLVCVGCRTRLRGASWPRCPRCHHPTGTGRDVHDTCVECDDWPESLVRARFAYLLRPPATDLVHALKYEGWSELAVTMGDAVAGVLRPELEGPHRSDDTQPIVVPVPTTTARAKQRGYHQAGLLAERVAEVLDVPYLAALRRDRGGGSQTTLSPDQREENVRDAFVISDHASERLNGTQVFLVDDVLTTGATAAEVARTLRRRGVHAVVLGVFARALRGAEVD